MLQKLINTRPWVLADGATGTNFFAMGLETGDAPELWNVDFPERVGIHYQSFIDAGSDIILTNTFGGTRYRLKLHNAQDRVHELNNAAAAIARKHADAVAHDVVVAGSLGPTGEILAPTGALTIEQASEAFTEQALALKEGGVDVLWIETMSSIEEVTAAVQGCTEVGLPMVFTLSIDTNGRTMMGVSPQDIARFEGRLPTRPLAYGTNCGIGPAEVVAAVVNITEAIPDDVSRPVIVAKANCGIPQWIDGKIVYNGTTELMADYARLALDAGATIIGGCCGTSPDHIAAMRAALARHVIGEIPSMETIVARLGDISSGSKAQLRGEMSVEAGAVTSRAPRRQSRRRKG